MIDPIFTYATKDKSRRWYGIAYDGYGILVFESEDKAEKNAKKAISTSKEDLEFIILDISSLIENNFISVDDLSK